MFNVDLIDPNRPWDLQRRLCDETLNECAKSGVSIVCSFGTCFAILTARCNRDPALREAVMEVAVAAYPLRGGGGARGPLLRDDERSEGELLLAFEIRVPAFHPQEEGFLRCLEESVGCRRRWVKPVPPA